MTTSAVFLALIAVSSAPTHLGVAGDVTALAALLRARARYVGARLRRKASSAS
jgi:hypothetical protein